MLQPCALMKAFAIPPPMIITSTLGKRFEITEILSVTLAPPIIAAIGVFGCTTAALNASISFLSKKPAAIGM